LSQLWNLDPAPGSGNGTCRYLGTRIWNLYPPSLWPQDLETVPAVSNKVSSTGLPSTTMPVLKVSNTVVLYSFGNWSLTNLGTNQDQNITKTPEEDVVQDVVAKKSL
jgi:hypothetical protein